MKKRENLLISILFAIGGLEYLASSIAILLVAPDPKNAVFLGFSIQRLFIFFVSLSFSVIAGYLGLQIYRTGIPGQIQSFFNQWSKVLRYLAVLIFFASLAVLIVPASSFGSLHGYFERLRPLIFVMGLLPFQFCLPTIFRGFKSPAILKHSLIVLLILALLWAVIAITGFGVTPEIYFWNVAGMPLTTLQLVLSLFICGLILGIFTLFRKRFQANDLVMDGILALILFILAVFVWTQTPMIKHYVSLEPVSPYYQPYPYSDSQDLDIGSISVIRGFGINHSRFTDKPLYMIFLALLHRLAGFNYNLIVFFQVIVLAIIAPAIFWLGKSFHSRFFGLLLALLTIYRQSNALILAHLVASANPKVLLTEIPTMLGMILLVLLLVYWFKHRDTRPWAALLAGGMLGAISLLRMNPLMLIPVIIMLVMVIMGLRKFAWLKPSIVFLAGFAIVLTPWIFTGVDNNGNSFLILKFQDVIRARYAPAIQTPVETPTAIPEADMGSGRLSAPAQTPPSNPASSITSFIDARIGVDVQKFPVFVINHSLHNLVDSFLTLPDSASSSEQDLTTLIERPYWVDSLTQSWKGEVSADQIPFLALNLVFLAIGITWSWKRWRWVGIIPLIIFLTYCVSLGFARNSGSRYTVPVDWIVFFYYGLGLVALAEFFPLGIDNILQIEPVNENPEFASNISSVPGRRIWFASMALVLAVASLVPLVQLPILTSSRKCQSVYANPALPAVADSNNQAYKLGEALYPRLINNKKQFFTFHYCDQGLYMETDKLPVQLYDTQPLIALTTNTTPPQIESLYSINQDSSLQLIWKK